MVIHEMKVARFSFLNRLFELTGGDEMKWYKEEIIAKDLDFDSSLTDLVSQYLKEEGLIEYHAFGPIIGITHYGLKVIEEALSNPDQPTNYFPPVEKITDKVKVLRKSKGEDTMKSTSVSIFISHSESDIIIAEALVDLLLSSLEINERAIRCTSVAGHQLDFGTSIPQLLKDDIQLSPIIIVLITNKSLSSKWVMFELGASWALDKKIYPFIGHSLSYENLPGPLENLPCVQIDDSDAQNRIRDSLKQIAQELNIDEKTGGKAQAKLDNFILKFRQYRDQEVLMNGKETEQVKLATESLLNKANTDPLNVLIEELEYNRIVAEHESSNEQGSPFNDEQYKMVVREGALSNAPETIKKSIRESYVATSRANQLVSAAWSQPHGGNAWAQGVNNAGKAIREARPKIDRALTELKQLLSLKRA